MLEDHFESERASWSDAVYLSQFCYVGDNIKTDLYFCKNSNIGSVLVLSGLVKMGEKNEEIKQANPTFILEKFSISE